MFSHAHGTSLHERIAHVSKMKGKITVVNKATNSKVIKLSLQ